MKRQTHHRSAWAGLAAMVAVGWLTVAPATAGVEGDFCYLDAPKNMEYCVFPSGISVAHVVGRGWWCYDGPAMGELALGDFLVVIKDPDKARSVFFERFKKEVGWEARAIEMGFRGAGKANVPVPLSPDIKEVRSEHCYTDADMKRVVEFVEKQINVVP